ncbi:hypothetical protein EV192_106364 [Actinocrispum wychmicini]|uniref:Uncharacterized protein n=2 Tax=Actinocrispum wychmicini TaxID=1213861 RepID=A0A4R2JK35_9PSEU|nr:hypothetical protein EV192_106364 [Actinocrispum wychmicini]
MDSKFKEAAIYRRIAEYLKWVELGSDRLTENQRERLRSFLDKLHERNLVVVFDPEIPPDAHNKYGGWATVPRLPSDGELLIRLNEYTHLAIPDEAEVIWSMPDDRP